MSDIKKEIQQKSFTDLQQEMIVSLLFLNTRIRLVLDELCSQEAITLPQYNILRILKGVYPKAHPRSEIRKRMIDRSDVTRLIDRLEAAGLVKRLEATVDQRHSLTSITPKGLKVIERLETPFHKAHGDLLHRLSESELRQLLSIVKKINI